MKRKVIIVWMLLAIFAYVPLSSAADNLTVKGDYYLRGRYEENRSHSSDNSDDRQYIHQRIRMDLFYQSAPDLTIEVRADWNEGAWGHEVDKAGVPDTTQSYKRTLQIDRALLKLTKRDLDITLGLQQPLGHGEFGFANIYSPQASGAAVQLRRGVIIDANFFKYSEGASDDEEADLLSDDKGTGTEDTDFYGIQFSYGVKKSKAGIYYAAKNDHQSGDKPQVVSIWGIKQAGTSTLALGYDHFFGDNGEQTDYVGDQLYLDASVFLDSSLKVGAHGFYIMGTDASNEEVVTNINVWGPWVPSISNGLPGYTWDGLEPLMAPHNNDVIGDNGGQMGGDIYFNIFFGPFEIGLQSYYFTPQKDSASDVKSELGVCGGMAYTWRKKAVIALGALYAAPDYEDDREDDPARGVQSVVKVKF